MSLYEKIIEIYPKLTADDFHPATGAILLMDDSDGYGPYIAKWEHPDFEQPSDKELGIKRAPPIIEGEVIKPAEMITSDKIIDMTVNADPVAEEPAAE